MIEPAASTVVEMVGTGPPRASWAGSSAWAEVRRQGHQGGSGVAFLYVSLKFILSGVGIVGLGRVDIFN